MRASEACDVRSIRTESTHKKYMHFNPLSLVEPSATLAMNALAQAKKSKGERVYNLSAGEPMLAPHPAVIEAATKAMESGKTLYPPVAGLMELRKLASEWLNSTYHTKFSHTNALVTCGGKFGLFGLCQALLTLGDEAMIVAPYWVSYPSMVKMFGGVPVIVKPEKDFKAQVADLEKARTKKTKVLFFNNAGNPTGVLYTRDEVKEILEWAQKNEVLVVSDEVYSGLVYSDTPSSVPALNGEGSVTATFVSCGSFPEYQDNVVVVQSCSKHFAMTGWRVGFVFGPEEIIKILTNIQSQSTTGTSSISQWAAVGAFEHASEIIPWVSSEMKKRRDTLLTALKEHLTIEMEVPAGLYVFVSMKDLGVSEIDSVKFCTELLEKANVALVPGAPFGAEGYVRMSFGETETELQEAVEALAKYLKK